MQIRHITQINSLINNYEFVSKHNKNDSFDMTDDPKPEVNYEPIIKELKYEKSCWGYLPNYIKAKGGFNWFYISYDNSNKVYTISLDDSKFDQLMRKLASFQEKRSVKLTYKYNYDKYGRMLVSITDIRKVDNEN